MRGINEDRGVKWGRIKGCGDSRWWDLRLNSRGLCGIISWVRDHRWEGWDYRVCQVVTLRLYWSEDVDILERERQNYSKMILYKHISLDANRRPVTLY